MKRRPWLNLFFFLTLILSACGGGGILGPESASVTVVNKYHKTVEATYCSQCHLLQGERYRPKEFDPIKACQDCHPPTGHNHPLAVTPRRPVVGLPLYDHKVACITCHDPHNSQGHRALLQKASKELCLSCHQK